MKLVSSFKHGQWFDSVDSFTDQDVVHVYDVFDQAYLDQLLASKGRPRYLVNDHFTQADWCVCLPLFLENCASKFQHGIEYVSDPQTLHCFNFQINKKQVNRFLCMKLIEYFALNNYDYTWSGVDNSFDMTEVIAEMDMLGQDSPISADQRGKILSPIAIEKKFVVPAHSMVQDKIGVSNTVDLPWVWQNVLQDIFYHSAVSLITESLHFQRATVFTEKTLYSVLGLTFPLWIGGGYQQAQEWKRLGFDTFDDVINHDYQHYHTLIERCYYAFELNLPLLSDLGLAAVARKNCWPRLLKNRELALSNHLAMFNDGITDLWPADLQSIAPELTALYRNPNL